MWNKIPSFLKNKYFIAVLIFAAWMAFFDRNSLLQRNKLSQDLKEQEQQRDFYLDEIRRDSITLHELSSDTQNLIRFAREQYLMKKPEEDVYLIIKKPADTLPAEKITN